MDERKMLVLISRLGRIVQIQRVSAILNNYKIILIEADCRSVETISYVQYLQWCFLNFAAVAWPDYDIRDHDSIGLYGIQVSWRARWKKGVSDDMKLKSKLVLFSFGNIVTKAGFHVRSTIVHLFLDLRSKIWRISVLLLRKKIFLNWTRSSEAWLISFVLCLN